MAAKVAAKIISSTGSNNYVGVNNNKSSRGGCCNYNVTCNKNNITLITPAEAATAAVAAT